MFLRKNYGLIRAASLIAVMALFAISGVVMVNVGVIVYKNIAEENLENYELQTALSYIRTKLEQNDEKGKVEIKNIADGTGLILKEHTDEGENIETVIYCYDGSIREFTHDADAPFQPEDGFEIIRAAAITVEMRDNGLVRLTATNTGGGSNYTYVVLRSEMEY